MSEPVNCKDVITTCYYSSHINLSGVSRSASYCCDYIGVEGHSRGCPPEACIKYRKLKAFETRPNSFNRMDDWT